MLDLKSDFYKRFSHDGGCCDEIFIPSPVTLFGTDAASSAQPIISLALGFGARAAYRKRADDRLIISKHNSDIIHSINKIDIDSATDDADGIFRALTALPSEICGFEMLLQSDTADEYFSASKLCALCAAEAVFNGRYAPAVTVRAADVPARYAVSLLPNGERAALINTATLDYIPYDLSLDRYKIVIAKLHGRHAALKIDNNFRERELERINIASEMLKKKRFESIFSLMLQSSRDMLKTSPAKNAEILFETCAELCFGVRLLNSMNGTIAFMPNDKIENYMRLVDDFYEKNTGTRPVFYVSD